MPSVGTWLYPKPELEAMHKLAECGANRDSKPLQTADDPPVELLSEQPFLTLAIPYARIMTFLEYQETNIDMLTYPGKLTIDDDVDLDGSEDDDARFLAMEQEEEDLKLSLRQLQMDLQHAPAEFHADIQDEITY